jgi:hypothetical protein
MGTRCLTNFRSGDKILCTLYRQMDGYPDGHGQELADFLSGFKVVNGINSNDERECPKLANGLGCLAAQVITHFKGDTSHYDQMHEMMRRMVAAHPDRPGFQAQLQAPIKRDFRVGSFYMHPPGDDGDADYTYTVYLNRQNQNEPSKLMLKVETGSSVVLFDGRPEDYDIEVINEKQEEADESN